jgi:hypothetical protein
VTSRASPTRRGPPDPARRDPLPDRDRRMTDGAASTPTSTGRPARAAPEGPHRDAPQRLAAGAGACAPASGSARGVLILIMVARLASLALPASTKYLVDDVIVRHDHALLVPLIIGVMMATLIQVVATSAASVMVAVDGCRMVAALRMRVHEEVVHLPVSFYDQTSSGALARHILDDSSGQESVRRAARGVCGWASHRGLCSCVADQDQPAADGDGTPMPRAFHTGVQVRVQTHPSTVCRDAGALFAGCRSTDRVNRRRTDRQGFQRRGARNPRLLQRCVSAVGGDAPRRQGHRADGGLHRISERHLDRRRHVPRGAGHSPVSSRSAGWLRSSRSCLF